MEMEKCPKCGKMHEGSCKEMDEKLTGNQHKIDADKDGKITGKDFKMLRKNKTESTEVEEGWDDMMKMVKDRAKEKGTGNFDKKKVSTGTVYTRKANKDGSSKGAKQESTVASADKKPEAYRDPATGKTKYRMVRTDKDMIKTESTIRQRLLAIFEKKDPHTANAVPAEPMDNNLKGAGAKKMKADFAGNAAPDDLEKNSHDDASKAGRVTKAAAGRPNDNKQGDKNIINPVDDITKKGTADAQVKESSLMDKAIAYLKNK